MSPETDDSALTRDSHPPDEPSPPSQHGLRAGPLAVGVGGGLALLLSAVVSGGLLWVRNRSNELSRALDAEIVSFRAQRWERPAPRGVSEGVNTPEGNAADAQRAALAALGPLDATLTAQLGPVLRGERPAPPEMQAMVRAHAAGLTTLRESVLRPYAHTAFVCSPSGPVSPEPRAHLAAVKSLLLLGELSGPGECLRAAADAVRLGHDMVPGGGLLPLMVSAAEVELAAPVALRCAARAGADEAREAAGAFERLSATPPPAGDAFQAEFLGIACMLRGVLRRAPLIPTGGEHGLLERPALVTAWDSLARDMTGWRTLRGEDYPAAAQPFRQRFETLAASSNPTLQTVLPDYRVYLDRDMIAQARLRALTVILHAIAARSEGQPGASFSAAPPAAIAHPALRDPYNGAALHWLAAPDGGLSVYSVGRDGRDAHGAPGSDDVGATLAR